MLTEAITLEVESDAARVFNEADRTDREKLQALFESSLRRYATSDVGELKRTMDEIRQNATARGLTPEILEKILKTD